MIETPTSGTAALLVALMFMVLPHAVWGQSSAPGKDVPPELRPPEGAKLILHALAKGDQIYVCKQQNEQYSWTLKAPEAQLFDESGHAIGRHFAGPAWEVRDKSAVTGKVLARADSPDKDGIPWLLLAAVDHSGSGLLSPVSHIQRLNTKGGKAPSLGCDGSHVGEESRVSYSADYLFYETKPAP